MVFIRIIFIFVWFLIGSFLALIMSLFRWGDLDLDHDIARLIARPALWIARVRVKVQGAVYLNQEPACIYVANHQHGLDVLTIGSLYPRRTIVIGKKELIWIPFFGIAFYASGNIMIDRGNPSRARASLDRAVAASKQRGASILIFPEGTRNRAYKGLLPFKKGAFHMAIAAQVPVIPIVCESLNRLDGWEEGRLRGGELTIRVLPPITTVGMSSKDIDQLSDLVRNRMLEALADLAADDPAAGSSARSREND